MEYGKDKKNGTILTVHMTTLVVNGSFNNKHVFMDFFLKTDQEMYATHIWNYSAFPKCNSTKVNKNYRTQAVR